MYCVEAMFSCYLLVLISISMVVCDDSIVYPCLTPNNETGVCVSLFSCPLLQKSLGTSTPSAIKFIKKSICSKWALNDLKVCCGKSGNFAGPENVSPAINLENKNEEGSNQINGTTHSSETMQDLNKTTNSDKEAYRDYVIRKLLPTITYCGLQHTDDRFYNESETALDEFPWLVHVLFGDEEVDGPDPLEFADRCNGVLINRRYVLTNGFCARNPSKVRLGQYNTNTTMTCIQNSNFDECTEPTIEVRIEEQIYRVDNPNGWYEFALFRLAKNVTYTDFVRPICLPFHDSRTAVTHENLIFSGWGAADQQGVVKKRLTYNSINVEECYKLEKDLKELSGNESLICLGPQEGSKNLACGGDEGSPLMYSYQHQWFADAIITNVYREPGDDCSNKMPIDGIRITPEVIEWILETIRP